MTDRGFESLVYRGNEARNFDYKGPMRWDAADLGCAGLIADILAMANSGGGAIVLGVAEDPSSAGGWDWQGIPPADLDSWDQTKLGEVVRGYAGASVEFTIDRAALDDKTFIVLTIAPFRKHPFICAKSREKDGEKGDRRYVLRRLAIYVRTDEAQTVELQSAEHFQDLIEIAIRQRRDEILAAVSAVLGGSDLRLARPARESFEQVTESIEAELREFDNADLRGCYIDVMFPAAYDGNRFTIPQLEHAVSIGARTLGHALFVRPPTQSVPMQRGDDFVGIFYLSAGQSGPHETFQFWQLHTSGLLVAVQRMWEDAVSTRNQIAPYLMPDSVIEHLANGIDALIGIYSALEVQSEEITWKLRMTGTRGRHVGNPFHVPPPFGGFRTADAEPVTWEHTTSIEEWSARRVDLAVEACQHIFDRFYWTRSPESAIRDQVDQLLWGRRP